MRCSKNFELFLWKIRLRINYREKFYVKIKFYDDM